MVECYSQSIDVEVSANSKRLQWAGILLALFSLGFVLFAIFYNWLFVFGVAVGGVIAFLLLHKYNKVAKEYTYEFAKTKLTVVSKDVVNRQKRLLTLLFKDVLSFEIMQDALDEKNDLLCCDKAYDSGVWQIEFVIDGKKRRLLFAPDEYMIALIQEALNEKITN